MGVLTAKSAQTYGDGTPVDAFPEDAAAAYLADVATLARTAVELRHELFVWMSP